MTSIIKFTALSGAQNEDPNCYLLQVDQFTFLLDCGWDEEFSEAIINNIKRHMSQIDAVLLTFPDAQHLGALPYLIGRLGMSCPVYATVPVYKMGQMFMYDQFQAHHNTEDFDKFSLDDVDTAFDKITQVKHNQTIALKDKGQGITITPIHAGHMIGGTTWKIIKDDEEGEIVYAVDFNHKRERHLNGCTLLESFGVGAGESSAIGSTRSPQLFITDAYNAAYVQSRRKLRDEELLTKIIETLRADGNVLIAVDTAGRVLELAILLEQLWRDSRSGLHAYSLAMLNNVTYNVVEFAKSMIEWMSDKIINSFTDQRNNPFEFKHLKLCHNLGDLAQVPNPKCVMASSTDLESGFARQLFERWCSDPRNSVIITGRTTVGTLARTLIDSPSLRTINLQIRKRVPIVGEELDEFEKKRKAKKSVDKESVLEKESSDESEEEEDFSTTAGSKRDLMVPQDHKKKGGGFFKQAKKAFPMFPFVESKLKWDEYGEIFNHADYGLVEAPPIIIESQPNVMEDEVIGEVENETEELPTKCVSFNRTLELRCSICYIDFEGRSDGESMLKIIQQIKPKEVILIRGSRMATEKFSSSLKKLLSGDQGSGKAASQAVQIFAPGVNEVVDTTKERRIYQVRLRDNLVSTLKFFETKESEICWLDAVVDYSDAARELQVIKQEEKMITDEEEEINPDEFSMDVAGVKMTDKDFELAIPTLELIRNNRLPTHCTEFINELRLSDFKQTLIKEGFRAEFIGGVLICNDTVAIRRNQQGLVDVEGCLSDEYYSIRELLYQQYAIL